MCPSVCRGCGKSIAGAYVTALGHVWHAEHFVCSLCGKPIREREFVDDKGKAFHRRCAEHGLLPRCAVCDQPILGRFLEDAWGRSYCGRHEQGKDSCGGCGAPIGRDEVWCARCRANEVWNEAALSRLYREVARWGERLGLDGVDRDVPLSFASRKELARALGGADGDRYGMTKIRTYVSLLVGRGRSYEVEGVSVLKGIPTALCRGVLAHEMGHVWFALCGRSGGERKLEEGFCEYLAHRYYGEHPLPCREHYRKGIEQNSDPVYGDGFRYVNRRIAETGLGQFVDGVRRAEIKS